jgi:hypothetical protein
MSIMSFYSMRDDLSGCIYWQNISSRVTRRQMSFETCCCNLTSCNPQRHPVLDTGYPEQNSNVYWGLRIKSAMTSLLPCQCNPTSRQIKSETSKIQLYPACFKSESSKVHSYFTCFKSDFF